MYSPADTKIIGIVDDQTTITIPVVTLPKTQRLALDKAVRHIFAPIYTLSPGSWPIGYLSADYIAEFKTAHDPHIVPYTADVAYIWYSVPAIQDFFDRLTYEHWQMLPPNARQLIELIYTI